MVRSWITPLIAIGVALSSAACADNDGSRASSGGATGSGGTGGAGGASATSGSGGLDDSARSCDSLDAGAFTATDGGACAPGSFCELLSADQFKMLFPAATAPYSYEGLVAAADGYYPTFTRVGDLPARKREAAAFLANVAHESGGFQYAEEIICANGQWMTNPDCARYIKNGISYHGRGAIQLSFLNNYNAASKALCVDLVSDPDQVATDPELAIGTAVWFWMERGKCHDSIVSGEGFGATVKAINGIECSSDDPVRISQWQDRLQLFTAISATMGIDPGDTSGCR